MLSIGRVNIIVMTVFWRSCVILVSTRLGRLRPHMDGMFMEIISISGIPIHRLVEFRMGTLVFVTGAYLADTFVMEYFRMEHFGHESYTNLFYNEYYLPN